MKMGRKNGGLGFQSAPSAGNYRSGIESEYRRAQRRRRLDLFTRLKRRKDLNKIPRVTMIYEIVDRRGKLVNLLERVV